jgi:ABC-2 type transport system ATP-binding protein
VEKTCEFAAVIDQGRLIAQGPIETLLTHGRPELDIGCDDSHLALGVLDGHPAIIASRETPDGVCLTLAQADPDAVADINARLVGAQIAVFRLQAVRESLEQRFLEITSRVGGGAS